MTRSLIQAFQKRVVRGRQLAALVGGVLWCVWGFPAPATADQVIDADNIVVVLDASGSMAAPMTGSTDPRMDVAKSALLEVVEQLSAETNLGLLVFGGTGRGGNWVYPLSPVEPNAFARGLAGVAPAGGTPLGQFIMLGANRLLEQRESQNGYGTYRLIVVTDGEAGDPELVERYTPQALARGITVEVIGVDMMADHSLARQVHAYRRADDPASLTRALVSSIAEVSFSQDDTTSDDGFELIAALPDGVAAVALGALRQSGNEPLGAAVRTGTNASASAPQAQPSPLPSGGTGGTGGTIGGGLSMGTLIFFVVVGAVLIQIVKAAAKRGSGG